MTAYMSGSTWFHAMEGRCSNLAAPPLLFCRQPPRSPGGRVRERLSLLALPFYCSIGTEEQPVRKCPAQFPGAMKGNPASGEFANDGPQTAPDLGKDADPRFDDEIDVETGGMKADIHSLAG